MKGDGQILESNKFTSVESRVYLRKENVISFQIIQYVGHLKSFPIVP